MHPQKRIGPLFGRKRRSKTNLKGIIVFANELRMYHQQPLKLTQNAQKVNQAGKANGQQSNQTHLCKTQKNNAKIQAKPIRAMTGGGQPKPSSAFSAGFMRA